MDRRRFLLTSLAGAFVAPLAAEAQEAKKIYRIGWLSPARSPSPAEPAATTLIPIALRRLGYVEGQNLILERRFAEGRLDRLPGLARELVELRVDLIVAVSAAAVRAAKEATITIPIVMGFSSDPVGQGFVESLARPGQNITGVALTPEGELAGKRLELLKEAVPSAGRIAVLSTDEATTRTQVDKARTAAPSLGVKLVVLDVGDADYERAFVMMVGQDAGALFVAASPRLHVDRKRIHRSTTGARTPRRAGLLPPVLNVDVPNRRLSGDAAGRTVKIVSVGHGGGRLVLHGEEIEMAGTAWNVVVDQKSGELTGAVVSRVGGYLVFGSCAN